MYLTPPRLPSSVALLMSFQSASKPYKEALELQSGIMAKVRDVEVKPGVVAILARSWCDLERMKRVMRGLPANTSQSIRQDAPKKGKRQTVNPGPVDADEPKHNGPSETNT